LKVDRREGQFYVYTLKRKDEKGLCPNKRKRLTGSKKEKGQKNSDSNARGREGLAHLS